IDGGRREELPAPAEQLLSEGREHPLAPLARGHERDAAAMLILENAPRRDARLILRRERVLIELRRSGPLRGQEVESEKRRVLCRKFRRRGDFLARQRPDDEVGALSGGERERVRHALSPGVVNAHARPLLRPGLVVRGQKPIAHADRGGGGAAGDRQQQRDVRCGLFHHSGRGARTAGGERRPREQLPVTRRLGTGARLGEARGAAEGEREGGSEYQADQRACQQHRLMALSSARRMRLLNGAAGSGGLRRGLYVAKMRGRLEVVATPIGNLADLSARAREALASADVIAAEDTRHTLNLLRAIGVARPLVS